MAIEYNGYASNSTYPHYDSSNYYEMRARATAERVRRCMFPEFTFEDATIDSEEFNTRTVLLELAEPSCSVREAIVDFLNVPDESKELSRRIESIIPLFSSANPQHSAAAAREVYLLSRSDAVAAFLAKNQDVVRALVHATRSDDLATQRDALAALSNLARFGDGRLHIFRSGGIAELIRKLSSPEESVRRYAVTTLHNLLLYLENSKEEIIALGGLKAFLPLLLEQNAKLQAMTADCVYLVLLDRPDCKQAFFAANGPSYLVNVLKTHSGAGGYFKLVYAIARCVRSVSVEQNNKVALVSMNAIEMLHSSMLQSDEPKRKLAFLNAIRNLSDAATNLDTLARLIEDLLALLARADEDEEIVSCACGILSNLTCNNVHNKQTVCEAGGVTTLIDVAGRSANIEDITEPALCTLRHCTVRNPHAKAAQTELVTTPHGYQIILSLLATRRPPIVKAALGVARNCAIQEANLSTLINERAANNETLLPITVEVLEHAGARLAQDFDGLTEGVSLLELVETAVSALHQLARDPSVPPFICANTTVMRILINLLGMDKINNNDDLLVLREVLGLLYQLSKSEEGAKTVKDYGAIPFIMDAFSSPSNAIVAYATVILRNLGVERPPQAISAVAYQPHSQASTETLGSNGRIVQQEYRGRHGWLNEGLEPELYNELFSTLGEMKHDHIESTPQSNSWFDTDL